ncbi:MAG: hypothetical protein ACK42D_03255 [Candidatus Paceibacteria bacterium]
MNKKNIILGVLVILLISGVAYAFLSVDRTSFNSDINQPQASDRPEEGPITEQGIITCIPKIGDGPQTMECALGLRNSDGTYFGLRHLSDNDEDFSLVSPEITVEVSGMLVHEDMYGPDGNRYDTVGIIEIMTISEI